MLMELFWKSRSIAKSRDDFVWLQRRTGFEPIKQHRNTLAIHYLQRDLFRGYPSDFPNTELAVPQKDIFALSREHLNTCERTIYTPRYLNSSTHIILSPDDIQTAVQSALLLGSILTQHYLLALTTMSIATSSCSHILNSHWSHHTEVSNRISSAYRTMYSPSNGEQDFARSSTYGKQKRRQNRMFRVEFYNSKHIRQHCVPLHTRVTFGEPWN